MRRLLSVTAAFVAVSFLAAGAVQAQTLDEIIAKNLKSKGGLDKIRATTSVKMTGKVAADGKDITMTIWAKRPNLMRREYTVDGQNMVNAFDGTTLWMSAGTAPPQAMPARRPPTRSRNPSSTACSSTTRKKGTRSSFSARRK